MQSLVRMDLPQQSGLEIRTTLFIEEGYVYNGNSCIIWSS